MRTSPPPASNDPPAPMLAASAFEQALERRLGPVVRALLWTALGGYLSFVLGGQITGHSGVPFWLRLAPGLPLVLLVVLGQVHRAPRHYGALGLAALSWLELGIFLNGYARPEGLAWILPAYVVVPIAASPIWLKRRYFVAAAVICALLGPLPLLVLEPAGRWELFQYLNYMVIALVVAAVLNGYQVRLIRQHLELERQLRLRADVDQLTGVATRARFLEDARHLLVAAIDRGAPLAVLYVDADHFKQLNDAHGHAAGDAALASMGRILRENLRGDDLIGRIGGEEFAVLLPGLELAAARLAGERLRHAVAAERSQGRALSISVGAAARQDETGLEPLLARADQALSAAKRNGRNRVEVVS
ncbi:GGDEF domain-containing protein [Metallibacterium scheffleri]|uniref:GGDEF domain-containing protein n=1 Tax=Metallibacterium scheffleri TaxID=993689 RepID=UPI001445DEB2|nr:GGDEF domain-containing protein [Metallibacterium scheffleri]